jgi:predicted negative regulator of RcsB-dependent stress response
MTDERETSVAELPRWSQHRFFILIAGVIGVALFLVSAALSLYNNSGASQLDFSSPTYQDIRKQARRDTTPVDFAATGKLDKTAFDQFKTMYAERTGKVLNVNSFDEKALSEESLQLLVDRTADQSVPAQ